VGSNEHDHEIRFFQSLAHLFCPVITWQNLIFRNPHSQAGLRKMQRQLLRSRLVFAGMTDEDLQDASVLDSPWSPQSMKIIDRITL
jgi:hypothetical protein